jgi:hypothetical protein
MNPAPRSALATEVDAPRSSPSPCPASSTRATAAARRAESTGGCADRLSSDDARPRGELVRVPPEPGVLELVHGVSSMRSRLPVKDLPPRCARADRCFGRPAAPGCSTTTGWPASLPRWSRRRSPERDRRDACAPASITTSPTTRAGASRRGTADRGRAGGAPTTATPSSAPRRSAAPVRAAHRRAAEGVGRG